MLFFAAVLFVFSGCERSPSVPMAEKLSERLMHPIYGPCSVVAQDKWYIIGGRVSRKVREGIDPYFTGYNIDVMQVIDMETGLIEKDMPKLPEPSAWGQAVSDNKHIYLIGGYTDGKPTAERPVGDEYANLVAVNSFYKYDIERKEWVLLEPVPFYKASGGTQILNNSIHVYGGVGDNDHYRYDFNQKEWERICPSPFGSYVSSMVLNGNLYAISSRNDSVYVFESDRWRPLFATGLTRKYTLSQLSQFTGYRNGLLLSGGATGTVNTKNVERFPDIYYIDVLEHSVQRIGLLPTKRCCGSTGVDIKRNQVYIAGGIVSDLTEIVEGDGALYRFDLTQAAIEP